MRSCDVAVDVRQGRIDLDCGYARRQVTMFPVLQIDLRNSVTVVTAGV